MRLFRLASEVLRGVEAGVFHPVVGWQCKECQGSMLGVGRELTDELTTVASGAPAGAI